MTDIVERLRDWSKMTHITSYQAADEIERLRNDYSILKRDYDALRAVITRAKDALLDGQSTQWVHDLLVNEGLLRALEPKP